MIFRIAVSFISALSLLFLIGGCRKSLLDEKLFAEQTKIEKFYVAKGLTFTKHNGVYHATRVKGYGYFPMFQDTITFWFVGYTLDGMVFETNIKELAIDLGLDTTIRSFSPITTTVTTGFLIEGLKRALPLCREGEVATIAFPSMYGFGERSAGPIPAESPLAYDILVTSISNKYIRQEKAEISSFLQSNPEFKQDSMGFWHKLPSGFGESSHPALGDTIFGWYRFSNLLGNKFYESPFEGEMIVLGSSQITEGLSLGYTRLNPRDIGQFIFPSPLGYGVLGNDNIPPFTPLFFELRLDSVKQK